MWSGRRRRRKQGRRQGLGSPTARRFTKERTSRVCAAARRIAAGAAAEQRQPAAAAAQHVSPRVAGPTASATRSTASTSAAERGVRPSAGSPRGHERVRNGDRGCPSIHRGLLRRGRQEPCVGDRQQQAPTSALRRDEGRERAPAGLRQRRATTSRGVGPERFGPFIRHQFAAFCIFVIVN